jgi:hypothetical protein
VALEAYLDLEISRAAGLLSRAANYVKRNYVKMSTSSACFVKCWQLGLSVQGLLADADRQARQHTPPHSASQRM